MKKLCYLQRCGDLPQCPPLRLVGWEQGIGWTLTSDMASLSHLSRNEGMANKGLLQFRGIRILEFRFMLKFSVCIILLKLWTEGLHLVVIWKYKI